MDKTVETIVNLLFKGKTPLPSNQYYSQSFTLLTTKLDFEFEKLLLTVLSVMEYLLRRRCSVEKVFLERLGVPNCKFWEKKKPSKFI